MDGSRDGGRGWGADARAQIAPLGVALLLGIVLFGTLAIVVFGGVALDQTQDRSQVQRAEHVLTLFDSRTAMVALGESDTQTTSLVGSGTYTVDESAGRIKLVHDDYNGTEDEVLYNDSMGALVYQTGDTEVAYQGGGVWRKEPEGRTRMVTPPEFYFRRSTLTFPLISIQNDDSASGAVDARVDASQRAVPIYPNETAAGVPGSDEVGAPYDPVTGYEEPYANPLENGSLVVYVESRYYEGWAEYFRTRTSANVTEFPSNQTVKADLVSLGERGRFAMPQEGNGILVRGLEGGGHSLQNFSFTITSDGLGPNADLSNLDWSMHAKNGQRLLEINLKTAGDVETTLYYSPDGGATYYAWKNASYTSIKTGDIDSDGEDEKYVTVDFTSDAEMTYQDKIAQNSLTWACADGNHPDTDTWDEHAGKVSWEPKNYSDGDRETMRNVSAHYFERMGASWMLRVKDSSNNPCNSGGNSNGGGGDTVQEANSFGRIDYPGSDRYIAYLHVTRNDVEIEFE